MGLEGDYLHFWGSNTQTNSRKEGGIVTKITKEFEIFFFIPRTKRGKLGDCFVPSEPRACYILLARKSDAIQDEA